MKWLGFAVLAIVALIGIVVAIGAALPSTHVASTRARIQAPREDVWRALTNVAEFPTWRSDVTSVEMITGVGQPVTWRETSKHGVILFQQVDASPPERLVSRIADEKLPFGGTWTYELAAVDGATELTITENGVVRNPLFRFMSRYVFGYHATQEAFIRSLGRKFDHDVTPQRVT